MSESLRDRVLHDPWGMNNVFAHTDHYTVPVMPHEHTSRTIYTNEAARRNAENRNASKLGGRVYKPKG